MCVIYQEQGHGDEPQHRQPRFPSLLFTGTLVCDSVATIHGLGSEREELKLRPRPVSCGSAYPRGSKDRSRNPVSKYAALCDHTASLLHSVGENDIARGTVEQISRAITP